MKKTNCVWKEGLLNCWCVLSAAFNNTKTPKQIPFQRDHKSDVPKRPNHIIGLMIAGPWRRLTEILIPYRFGLSLGVFFCRRKWFLKVESGFLTFDKPGWYWFYPKSNFVGENQQTISSLNARQTCNQFFNMSPAQNITFKHNWTKLNGGRMAIIILKSLNFYFIVILSRQIE